METERIKLGETEEQQKILESGMLEGEQVHINHEGCPAGTDTKKRLYIKRTDKGWVAYCHHCSGVGYKLEKEPSIRNVLSLSETCEEPPDTSKRGVDYTQWSQILSIDGKMYLAQYGIDKYDAAVLDIREKDGWICFPLYHGRDYLATLGMPEEHVRRFNDINTVVTNATFRKLTNKAYKKVGDLDFSFNYGADYIVITEDLLSAYIIWLHGACETVPLFGTHLSPTMLTEIADKCRNNNYETTVVLWLDDDTAGRLATLDLVNQLSQVGCKDVKVLTKPEAKMIPQHLRKEIYSWVRE